MSINTGSGVTDAWTGAEFEAVQRAAIDAYEAATPPDYRYSAVGLRKAIVAALEAASRVSPSPGGAADNAVAWRYTTGDIDGDEWPWTATTNKSVADRFSIVEPLYASPPIPADGRDAGTPYVSTVEREYAAGVNMAIGAEIEISEARDAGLREALEIAKGEILSREVESKGVKPTSAGPLGELCLSIGGAASAKSIARQIESLIGAKP